jgi:iron complex transport system substrate-binding protein
MPRDTTRIVSLAPNITSILHALGAMQNVVAVSRWCQDVAPAVANLPTVGDCWKLSIPELMRHNPTLVIGSVPFAVETVEEILAQPVAFLAINPRTLADIERDILTLGRLTSRAAAAERLITKMRRSYDAIRKKSRVRARAGAAEPIVYSEAWSNPRISSPPWVAELIEMCGAQPAVTAGAQVSDDEVARANPDVIVLAWTATGDRANPDSALNNPNWREVTAVKSARVHVIRDELLNTPGPPLIEGAAALYRTIWNEPATPRDQRPSKRSRGRSAC